eukprot:TRINITY_DN689_c0_g1_i1.p1 TRINITY_DN689_c0_g1~~TRINITY_DN689_c0_g1_i1.p1  ORF type:complete len:496 (+),score=104.87 TRINITY_DN689_c0_g1_i1:173-1489(+)
MPAPVPRPSSFPAKRVCAVGAGLLGLAGCAGALLSGASARQEVQPSDRFHVSARALLEHPEFIDVASNNVWQLGREHMAGKEQKLKPAVQHMMSQLSKILKDTDPEGSNHLDSIKLSPEQRQKVLDKVKKMGDGRVQKLGKEVLEIAIKNREKSPEDIEKQVRQSFQPRLKELQDLEKAVLPVVLRHEEQQAATPAIQKSRRLATTHSKTTQSKSLQSQLTNGMGTDMSMKIEDALAVIGGLAEQARLALDEASVIGTSFGSAQHHVPYYWRSLIGGVAFGAETLDCFMRQDDEHKTNKDGTSVLVSGESGQANSVKMAMCPMKYAGAGMDFISGVNNAMGIQNNRLPQDFQMMFGGGQPQAGYNPYGGVRAAPAPANPFSMFAPHPAMQPAHPAQMYGAQPHPAMYGAQPHPAMYGAQPHPAMYGGAQQHPGFAYAR